MTKKEKTILKAEIRQVFGKKVKKLRKQGLIPANVFGKDFKSQAITISAKDFIKIYKKVKETGVLYLEIGKETLPVLITSVQKHPVTHNILHVDFKKVDLTQKTQAEVPVEIVGQSPAVSEKGGILLTLTNSLLIEALPEEIPHSIKVDVSNLSEIGQEIKVADLPSASTYQIITEKEKVIVSVVAHKEESITPETQPKETPEIITEKKETTQEVKEEEKNKAQTSEEKK